MPATPAALIAHDLKNALGVLEGELEALTSAPSADRAAAAHQRCVDLRREFVQFLIVYGTEGELRSYCEDESPQDALDSACQAGVSRYLRQPLAPQITIDRAGEAPPFWYFDTRLVHMALDAALHNASRFAQRQITLSAREDQGYLVFSIDDDGPGLGCPDASPASTGLGTELCRAVAQAHRSGSRQGRIELLNRSQGGTRFELWIP